VSKSFPWSLKRDEIGTNRHRALGYCLSTIFSEKPLHTFPDHALGFTMRHGIVVPALSSHDIYILIAGAAKNFKTQDRKNGRVRARNCESAMELSCDDGIEPA
jgi:hypothetical protein